MSFLSTAISVPLWLLIFTIACAAVLWLKWYKYIYKNLFEKDDFYDSEESAVDKEASILQKATAHWSASTELNRRDTAVRKLSNYSKSKSHSASTSISSSSSRTQPYVKIVLKMLAASGDTGMLLQSIADKLGIKSNDVKSSLAYLEKNNFVEAIAIASGTKYYLTGRGKKYCIKRGHVRG